MTDRRTRLALFPVSLVLWLAAMAVRFARWSERPTEEQDSYWVVLALVGVTLAYVAWRVGLVVTDTEWLWGWRD